VGCKRLDATETLRGNSPKGSLLPRACGEHVETHDSCVFLGLFSRARVGNTMTSLIQGCRISLLPRACGKHETLWQFAIRFSISPVRVWIPHSQLRIRLLMTTPDSGVSQSLRALFQVFFFFGAFLRCGITLMPPNGITLMPPAKVFHKVNLSHANGCCIQSGVPPPFGAGYSVFRVLPVYHARRPCWSSGRHGQSVVG
jgi:hypothetical protein